ncbi:hypothetical protein NLG97_g4710 [Lecanicillium saksenae]|uniref:Uncharacterized protein n=1 Tax=Lecanicillium saksenae TaxID=468837 RepID=A0ACC1QX36_9HYPO|nr:hypothetical protein NLG97_g4710 [Lecanicillium saksenae]
MAPFSTHSSYLAALEDIRSGCIAGPYPAFFRKFFSSDEIPESPRASVDATESGPRFEENSPPPPPKSLGEKSGWLVTLLKAQQPEDNWIWMPYKITEATLWMSSGVHIMVPQQRGECDAQTVGAICHVADSLETYQAGLVHLYCMANHVFRTEEMRFFLHGILLCQSSVEFWVFDRSGMYSSPALSLVDDCDQIASNIASLRRMTSGELGAEKVFDAVQGTDVLAFRTPNATLQLLKRPVVARDSLFSDGLLCYFARKANENQWTHIVKFKWRDIHKSKEEDIFHTIEDKSFPGVVRLVYDTKIVDTAQLRAGVRNEPYRRLLDDGQELDTGSALERYSERTGDPFRNRTCMCLVFSPICQPLSTFRDKVELLRVLRDVAQTHRALLQDANVLHRDISIGNILIDETTRKGILIDFDVAMDLTKETPTGNSISGTQEFRAAGLMNYDPHTYRHDLEALFYVLLQVIAEASNNGTLERNSRFHRWSVDDWDKARDARIEDMESVNFELLLDEWAEEFGDCKALARHLRCLLFGDGTDLFFGTDMSIQGTNALYDGFIDAFEDAITTVSAADGGCD